MSGQRVNTHADKNKKRNEYLESLALQEQINDINLQANKNYLLTGQLPPQSQLQDTRTTSEKLKDLELMKQKIVGDFDGILTAQGVYTLIQKILDSPLNLNNSLFRFFTQRAPSISEQFKRLYSLGSEGDANDIERIFEYIKNMYSDTQDKFQTTKSYMNSLSSGSMSSKIIGANDLDIVINQLEDLIKNIQYTIQRGVNKGGIKNSAGILRDISIRISNLKQTIPNTYQMNILMSEFNNPIGNIDIDRRKSYEAYFSLIEKLPKYKEVLSLIQKINQFIQSDNFETASDGIRRLKNMFGILYEDKTEEIMINFLYFYKDPLDSRIENERQLTDIQRISDIENMENEKKQASKAQKVYIINPESDPVWVRNPNGILPIGNIPQGGFPQGEFPQGGFPEEKNDMPIEYREGPVSKNKLIIDNLKSINDREQITDIASSILNNPLFSEDRVINRFNRTDKYGVSNEYKDSLDTLSDFINGSNYPLQLIKQKIILILNSIQSYNPSTIPPKNPLGIAGLGIKTKGSKNIKGGSILHDFEYKNNIQSKEDLRKKGNFVGFGINEINQKQLEKGLVKIRRSTKTNYMDLPTKRVSSNLQNILKTIIGGGVPNYNDLGKLDEEEKIYLNKLISRSELTDRISVPAPSKDQQEKDIHNFEVMRGQIMSGNDSQELVKQFKLIIRKLMRQGLLPKSDVEDILSTLIELGY